MYSLRCEYQLPQGTDFSKVAADTISIIKDKIRGRYNSFYRIGWLMTGEYGPSIYLTFFVECNIITHTMLSDIQLESKRNSHYPIIELEML